MPFKKTWSGVLPLSILLAIIGGIFILGRIGRGIEETVIKKGVETVGVLFDEGKRMIRVRYYVDGKEYTTGVGKAYSYIQDGEEFLIKYLPDNPTSIVVFFDKPILSGQYQYIETNCTTMNKSLSVINFQYEVDEKVIRRETLFNDRSLNPSDYIVKYRKNNPNIGYLIMKE
jgi:hypothetical protein